MYQKIRKSIKSDINIVNEVVKEILLSIKNNLEDEQLFNIRLVLSELIINSIQHGNKYDINKNIDIVLVVEDTFIKVCVTDEGDGFCYEENLNDSNFTENGRGLILVNGLMDRCVIDNNIVLCVKYIK
ncbi:ATP-binding protein [Sedimentibacter sp. zth1]|uniref:ATP-binding protein n=1 Tax=Sedimentibacter sp. zth1 TaxID=2816908 RepID=UPI001A91C630|nr:ATP-binding protein [Sedimentibacter sp. zth1]QSX06898.1 ATP-binding protein [Sedimentibacter sp. zth1]